MNEALQRRRGPFLFLAAFTFLLCLAVIQIPDTFLAQIERNRPLSNAQAGWVYRLIAMAAIGQALYGGFGIFRIERVQRARESDERFAALTQERMVSSLARNAAGMVVLTLIYGLATVAVTGLRGGFWLFPTIAAAQGAWYYRELGQIARWNALQPDVGTKSDRDARWTGDYPGFVPAVTRGLRSRSSRAGPK